MSAALVATKLHVPVAATMVTAPVFALTVHTPGDVVAKTTPPAPLPPDVATVTDAW